MERLIYEIYQIRETHRNRYMSYEYANAHGGVNLRDYERVYTGTISSVDTTETLERLYAVFNRPDLPAGYAGRSLSVSDIVVLEDAGAYFCDSIGWRKLAI